MTHGLSPRVSEVHSQDMILPKNRRYCKEKLINFIFQIVKSLNDQEKS